MIAYTHTATRKDLEQILQLQRKNLEDSLAQDEVQSQGFVTVKHDFPLLEAMSRPFPHVIAKAPGGVIAYALVMLPTMADQIPVLFPLFEKINSLSYQHASLQHIPYFVMGQICIQKVYRGKGVFAGLYEKMRQQMHQDFACVITEVATRNTRSMRAHEKVGFQNLHTYTSESGEHWAILLWDWK